MRNLSRWISFCIACVFITVSLTRYAQISASASAATLPVGFVDEVVYGGLLAPRAFTFLPDGRVLAVERGSAVSTDPNLASIRVFKNGALLPDRAYTVNTCGDSERGLLGIVADPNFVSNGYIYIYYTRRATSGLICGLHTFTNNDNSGPRNRISRLTMSGDGVVPGSEVVLIDSIVSDGGNHNAGDLHFGADGYLYATTGDGAVSSLSPSTSTLNGKLLRILPTAGSGGGYTTAGNPYDAAPNAHTCSTITIPVPIGPCKEIFAKGFRNPFRFTMQPTMAGIPGSGLPFVGDVGQVTWEEIDQVQAGGDYGWPVREGFCITGVLCGPPYQSGGYANPLYSYPHFTLSAAIIGGDFYTGGAGYPVDYTNNYFFADFSRNFIARLAYNSLSGQWTRLPDFSLNAGGVVDIQRGPDGNIYYLTFTSATSRIDGIHRIRYVQPANAAPLRSYFTTATPTLTWNPITWATRYTVQVSLSSAFTEAAVFPAGNNLTLTLPTTTNGFYYWRVAGCTDTSCGGWSAFDTFVVDAP